MVDGLDSAKRREEIFLERLGSFRRRMRNATLSHADAIGFREREVIALERDLDGLLMEAANLAREPMLRHMVKITEATLLASPLRTLYTDTPAKAAELPK